jgi:predicted PurR-regulated permease PerM
LILGQTVMLHPVVIIFSFLAGTVLFGMLGLLWAIPVAAAVRIVTADLYGEPIS